MYNVFTKHCLERMQQRQISHGDVEEVLAKGFYRHDPRHQIYKVEYDNIIIVISYDGQIITAYHAEKNFSVGRHPDLKCRLFRRKREQLRYPDWKQKLESAV